MKPMILCVTLIVAGVSACGFLVLRHACLVAPLTPATWPQRPAVGHVKRSIRSRAPINDAAERFATACLLARLRREEARQRPWEGRN